MATFTAQILVGQSHQNHGGIVPSHTVFLSENSRPAWILMPLRFPEAHAGRKSGTIVWMPTIEHMLEDALLMIAVHVLHEPAIVAQTQAAAGKNDITRLELSTDITPAEREGLYEQCRALAYPLALVLTTLQGSTIRPQVSILKSYTIDVDVCQPVYSRHYSAWAQEIQITGSLE